jgi:hypothetical protein
MIATERQPSDQSWIDLCAEQGIVLVWPGIMHLGQRQYGTAAHHKGPVHTAQAGEP